MVTVSLKSVGVWRHRQRSPSEVWNHSPIVPILHCSTCNSLLVSVVCRGSPCQITT